MKTRIIILLIFALPLLAYAVLSATMPVNTYQAIAVQPKTSKAIIIKFSAPLCMDCQTLDKTMQKVFSKFTNEDFEYQKIDVTSNKKEVKELIKKHKVTVVPTSVFINKEGKIVKRIEGDISEKDLEKLIKAIK